MKSRGGKSQRRQEKKKEKRVRRKKIQVREKVANLRNTVFFQWFEAPEGRKVRLAKAAGAEPSGQMRDEKLHAVVARRHFPSQNVQNTPCSDHFWKLRCLKRCTPLWREARNEEVSQNCFVFWRCQAAKIEEVLLNCCVFDVVQFKQLRKSRRIASFWMVSSTKIEEVSQNCFVLDVVKFKNWGSVAK